MSHVDHDHRRVIAIDGPAAAGKTTVARLLANRVGAMLFDTGALYRAVTLAVLRADGSPSDAVATTAIRVVANMNREWMTTGRRPAGICGAWPAEVPAASAHLA